MAKVILFGGGDGGGIRIGESGVEPIPPFDPKLRYQLRALSDLVRSSQLMHRSRDRKLASIIKELTSSVLGHVESAVGELDRDNGLVYQDDDGGFTCGSSGKPPLPFPWPVDPRRTVDELLARGTLDRATLEFLEVAARHKLDVFTVAKDPEAVARKIGVDLPPEVASSLQALRLNADELEDELDREVVDFYQKVVVDGRYVSDWAVRPEVVAGKLDVQVSAKALQRIAEVRDGGVTGPLNPGGVMSPAAVAVAVAIVIVLWSREATLPVLDRSGIAKL